MKHLEIMTKKTNRSVILISLIGLGFFSLIAVSFRQKSNGDGLGLPEKWKFQPGDNSAYSQPGFDDSKWKDIPVGVDWESQSYDSYDGIAWYRSKVIIPSSFKSKNPVSSTLKIALGKIDDFDETYVNGKLIGRTNDWQIERVYLIPSNIIRWDEENTIAVRVNDFSGKGGMLAGPYAIRNTLQLSDILTVTAKVDSAKNSTSGQSVFFKLLLFNFKTPVDKLEGVLKVRVFNPMNKKVLFKKEEAITIGNQAQADTAYQVNAAINELGAYLMEASFTANHFTDTLKYSTLYAYVPVKRTGEKLASPLVNLTIPNKTAALAFEHIQLGGYLNERLTANMVQRLLKIDETGILEGYYSRPGKQTWVGEYPGKYLHAASRAWRYSKNAQLKTQMDRIVDILLACQREDGYLGTYLPANYWTDWDVWAHKYNMLGLLSYYSATGYQPALEASKKMGDLLCKTFGEGKGQRNIVESSGHVGMASTSVLEPMTELYRYTGDKKYLDFCNYIIKAYDSPNGPNIISTLNTVGKVNKTANAKAYEMMSNLTGIVKLYQLTGHTSLLNAATIAWNDVAANKLYITGTASKQEYFQEDFVLPAGNEVHMGEGCVTTTWLQFSQALYNLTGEAKYMDEIEKTIYNHLFAAENPRTGCVSYYTALQGKKPFRCSIDAHCCLASIPRGIAAIPELAFTKNAQNGFNLNLYTPGKFADQVKTKDGQEVAVACVLETTFPENGRVTIQLNPETKTEFRLALRVPAWCSNFKAVVNGKIRKGIPGTYLNLDQEWDKHSIIKVSFDLNTKVLDGGISYPNSIALRVGPQVLAVDQALNPQIKEVDQLTIGEPLLTNITKAVLPKGWVGSQVFKTKAYYKSKPIELILVPFADAGETDGEVRVWIPK